MQPTLLQRVAEGNREAMQECIDRYGGLIWSLTRRWAMDRADAEDAVQEVFITIWKSAGRYDPSVSSEPAFITMLARRRLIDQGRRRARLKERTTLDDVPSEEMAVTADPSENLPDGGRAIQALKRLNDKQRQVLELSIQKGMSHSEIASKTGMPLGTVKSHARRGLIQIREMLGGTSDEITEEAAR